MSGESKAPGAGQEEPLDLDQIVKSGLKEFTGQDFTGVLGEDTGAGQEKNLETPQDQKGSVEHQKETEEGQGAGQPLEEENRKLRERLEGFEKADQDRQKKADSQKAEEEFSKTVFEFSKARNRKALAEIDKLDPDDFENNDAYQDKVAEIWAEKDRDISTLLRNQGTDGKPAGRQEEISAKPGERADKAPGRQTWDEAIELASKQGIEEADRDFIVFAQQAPETDETGKPLDFYDQVNWAIKETKQYKEFRHLTQNGMSATDAAARAAARHQEINSPLGRGSATPPAGRLPEGTADRAPVVTLSDALEFVAERRRL